MHHWLRPLFNLLAIWLVMMNAANANPYGLITDAQWHDQAPAIAKLWSETQAGQFSTDDGLSLPYRILRHPEPKAAIVIVNGRTETFEKYQELAFNLYQQGYSSYLYDQRGQGLAPRLLADPDKGYVGSFQDYVADLHAFIQQMVKPDQAPAQFILAHSMGSAVAALYLQQQGKAALGEINAAVLAAPMFEINLPGWQPITCAAVWSLTQWDRLRKQESGYAPSQGPFVTKDFSEADELKLTHSQERFDANQALFKRLPQTRLGGATNQWLLQACAARKQIIEHAADIAIPVLVLQAGNDGAVTSEGQERFCHALASSPEGQCEFGKPVVIAGAYHELLQEADEYRLPAMTTILDFLGKYQ